MEVLSCWFLVLSQKKDLAGLPQVEAEGQPIGRDRLLAAMNQGLNSENLRLKLGLKSED